MTTAATDVLARPSRPSSNPGSPGSPAAAPSVPSVPSVPPAPPALPAARRRRARSRWTTYLTFLLLAGPNVALLVVFVYKPLLQSFQYSTLQWNIGSPSARSVGMGNYVDWFTDPRTPQVLTTTAIFTVATVGGSLLIGLALALLLNRRLAGRGAARTIVFAPYVLSGIAVGILWLFIFDPRYGLVSTVLGWVGLSSPDWYNDSPWALAMIIIVYLWKNVGYVALIYLAGLQAVPQELRDAAALDGAGPGRTLRSVVLPLLGPTTFFLSVTSLLSSLQSFDIIHAMTQGGPLAGTTTLMYQIYQESFVSGRAGYASAVATILFVLLAVITVAQLKLVERKVHY